MTKSKILYAEDDQTIAFLIQDSLENHYDIHYCPDGRSAMEAFDNNDFDICLLDIMMPGMDGFELAQHIRSKDSEIPIIFISAKALKEDRIKGLKIGADDYLVKPFSIEELILKIEIFLKRSKKREPVFTNYRVGDFSFDPQNYTLKDKSGKIVSLTQRESELLLFFIKNKNIVLKRQEILKAIWGDDDYFMGRSLDVFISRLRKIFSGDDRISIENIHGIGFRFSEK
ncbi:response regulator transcription factor [Chryseobacterium echinoideorum]|uniref:response regulator transcription factor n=1 Tax=Chryseobacterium echinoideorum TaxID=1549648 RepID=UPI001184A1F0|nr:response regulator transcription factor [Chryseobacterium echinoideorum]